MNKEVLQITILQGKEFKTKFGKWFYWRIWFKVWGIYKPKFLAWFFGLFLSKETKRNMFNDLEIKIKTKIQNGKTTTDNS